MKYRELLIELQKLTDEQLNMDCAVYVPWEGEYFSIDRELSYATKDNDILNNEHPIIYVKACLSYLKLCGQMNII